MLLNFKIYDVLYIKTSMKIGKIFSMNCKKNYYTPQGENNLLYNHDKDCLGIS